MLAMYIATCNYVATYVRTYKYVHSYSSQLISGVVNFIHHKKLQACS